MYSLFLAEYGMYIKTICFFSCLVASCEVQTYHPPPPESDHDRATFKPIDKVQYVNTDRYVTV